MEVETSIDETHKKGRQRKKQLYNSILQQMEFYFSDSNLTKDRFLSQLIDESEYVDVELFLKFNKLRKITSSVSDIIKSIQKSDLLELSTDLTKVKRINPIQIKTNIEDCTIYVQHIKSDTTHEWLKSIFSDFGNVVYISMPKYKKNNLNKGFAFIEFENESEAQNAVEYFKTIDCKISPLMEPGELCSIVTFQKEDESDTKNAKETNDKKRKLDNLDSESANKKIKRDEDKDESSEQENDEVKKKKKKSNKKKSLIKELGLQVLTKKEWRSMRNRYLNMQRDKMKELKRHLNKKRFGNKFEDKQKHEPNEQENINGEKPKMDYIPGVIVQLKLSKPYSDSKKLKNEIKTSCSDAQYVETPVTVGNDEVYIRFSTNESAKLFAKSNENGICSVLEGEEEKNYWDKIRNSRETKLNKEHKKQRGRDKLLKKAERELGKHIRFDNDD